MVSGAVADTDRGGGGQFTLFSLVLSLPGSGRLLREGTGAVGWRVRHMPKTAVVADGTAWGSLSQVGDDSTSALYLVDHSALFYSCVSDSRLGSRQLSRGRRPICHYGDARCQMPAVLKPVGGAASTALLGAEAASVRYSTDTSDGPDGWPGAWEKPGCGLI
jgi:hypothetical protein